MVNQSPEHKVRDRIDLILRNAGWAIQDNKKKVNLSESLGVAVRKFQTAIGSADYVLLVPRCFEWIALEPITPFN